ncbi:uncharacterized protein LOC130942643 [Arachis stenosperma]|uniref:uncharacterized protein LOC130942643 n=1 Tax=Arachis stenosperma TaxID=217475 RepID=UPI0025AC052D|nr:uncharacterized protein LOC130942643 [Arachis stenosperma]
MGNYCCNATSRSTEWGGEDWSDLNPRKMNTVNIKRRSKKVFDEGQVLSIGRAEKEKLFGELGATICNNDNNNNNGSRIKIRISKKDLAKLLGDDTSTTIQEHNKGKLQHRSSAEQVLLRLLKARDDSLHINTPWKPQLESIPEER